MRVSQAERQPVLDDVPIAAQVRHRAPPAAPKWTAHSWHIAWLIRIVPAVVPGLLMLGIGLRGAGRPVLSWDEVATVDVAGRSPAQIWHLIHNLDAVFGPYYFFMHLWTSVAGTSVLDLRLPSIVAMAGAVAVAGELARRLFTPIIGLVTGLLLGLLPNTSRYAAEARPYAFACFFTVLALLLLYRALERPGVLRWLGYALAVAAVGCSHIVALTTLGAHVVVVALHLRETRSRRIAAGWALAMLAALVAVAPLAWLGTGQQQRQLGWVEPLTVEALRSSPAAIVGSAEVAWLLIGLAVVAAWNPARRLAGPVLAVLLPLVAVALVSALAAPMWVTRYLLIVLVPAAMLAAVGTVGTDRRWGTGASAACVLTVLVLLAFAAYPAQYSLRRAHAKNGFDYRGAAAVIERDQQPGDGLVYAMGSRTLRPGIDYYLSQDPGRPRDLLLRRAAAANATLIADEFPHAAEHLDGVPRVWLLVGGTEKDLTAQRADLAPVLSSRYQRVGLWHLKRTTLALYVRRQ